MLLLPVFGVKILIIPQDKLCHSHRGMTGNPCGLNFCPVPAMLSDFVGVISIKSPEPRYIVLCVRCTEVCILYIIHMDYSDFTSFLKQKNGYHAFKLGL